MTSDADEESSRSVLPGAAHAGPGVDAGDVPEAADTEPDDRPAPTMLQRAIDGPGSGPEPARSLPTDPELGAVIDSIDRSSSAVTSSPSKSRPGQGSSVPGGGSEGDADDIARRDASFDHDPGTERATGEDHEIDGELAIDSPPSADTAAPALPSLDDLLGTTHPGAARPLPRVLAVANQKGGVGKTTTTINLAACLADMGYRVLVVDLDPQANATTGLGIDPRSIETSMYDVILQGVPMQECALPTELPTLWIAPSSLDLAGAEIELVPAFNRERKVLLALEPLLGELDYVFIDCPPSLGLLTVNALTAASEVLVPIQCEYYALEGLGQLLRNVELVQRNLNQQLEVSTIALVMYDARTRLSTQVVDEVRAHFGDKVCRQIVPRSVRLSEAPSFGQPIILFDDRSRGALAYRQLAKEVSGGPPNRTR